MIKQEVLQDLRKMLEGWGIGPDDWYVTGEAAMLLSDYPVDFRDGNIDVLVCRSVWPWPRPEEIGNLIPDDGTKAHDDFEAFVEKHGFTPDFHPLPHVGLRAEDRFDHAYWLPDETGVRVLKPAAGALHRKTIIEFYEQSPELNLDVFDQKKFIRWKGFIETIRDHAQTLEDQETVAACEVTLPAVDRAIAFFEGGEDHKLEDGGVRGCPAHSGVVEGAAQHWEEGADFKGKIAVLTHSLPSQVTALRHAAGIVTDQGGTLSHAAIIAREYKIPTVIGTKQATQIFQNGDRLKMDAGKGVVEKQV